MLATCLALQLAALVPRALPQQRCCVRPIMSAEAADATDATFTDAQRAALLDAADKPTGRYFGGSGSGTSWLKLKAAATGGPLAADAWAEVRADHAVLADKTDDALAAAFLLLEREQRPVAKASDGGATSPSDALQGVVPLAAVALVAVASTTFLSAGGGCDSALANAAACAERAERVSGVTKQTPLSKYREQALGGSAETLQAYARPEAPRALLPDVSAGVSRLGDPDWWKGVK